jgi:hypothetical protein
MTALFIHWKLFCLVVFLLITGCAPVYYPNARNIPSINKADQAQFTGMVGLAGWDVMALYNFHKNFGVMANGSFAYNTRQNREIQIEGPRFHRHLFGETGIGYYRSLGWARSTIALYGGVGWGNSSSHNTIAAGNFISQKGIYQRYFIQPSVSLDLKHVNFSFGGRFSNLNFQSFETQNGVQEPPKDEWFIETFTEVSAKMEDFDFVVQVGVNKPLSDEAVNFHYRALHASVGIRYNLTK